MMLRKALSSLFFVAVLALGIFIFHPGHSKASFVASDLMSDGIFENTSYSAAQIDAFLNTFPNSCISTNNGFTAAEPIGYTPSTSFKYGNYVSAGTIIYDAAIAYGINPRVLLATMEKEQNLFTGVGSRCHDSDANTRALAYAASMGYGCPDGGTTYNWTPNPSLYAINGVAVTSVSGTCVNSSHVTGFSPQVIVAAWKLRFNEQRSEGNVNWNVQLSNFPHSGDTWDNSDDPTTTYSGPMTQGCFQRYQGDTNYPCPPGTAYDGYTVIDGSSTHMDTGATASLYYYTPHFAGNQNFVSIYETYFGPTKGVDYSFQYVGVAFSGASTSANVQGNTQVTVTLTAENTGNQAWSNTNFPIRIGTWSPTNHQSALYDSSWVSTTRPATLNQSTVQSGANGTFTFKINIPNRSGAYSEMFDLVAEGSTWMSGGFELQLNITPSVYSWQMVSQSSTNGWALAPGQTSQLTLKAKNTGNVTWTNSGSPVRLATWLPTSHNSPFCSDNTNWVAGCYRAATLQEASIAPGGTGTFVFTVQAPATQQLYTEHYNLVMEGVSWFQDAGVEFDINVVRNTAWHMVSQTSSNGWTLSPGQTSQITLVAHNDGNITWTNANNPVRLATWNPPYRNSVFCSDNTNWVQGCYRAATLQESSVAPGSNGTFVFTVQAPSKTGFYAERFNLVMEGVAWFTDPWLEFDFTVH